MRSNACARFRLEIEAFLAIRTQNVLDRPPMTRPAVQDEDLGVGIRKQDIDLVDCVPE